MMPLPGDNKRGIRTLRTAYRLTGQLLCCLLSFTAGCLIGGSIL